MPHNMALLLLTEKRTNVHIYVIYITSQDVKTTINLYVTIAKAKINMALHHRRQSPSTLYLFMYSRDLRYMNMYINSFMYTENVVFHTYCGSLSFVQDYHYPFFFNLCNSSLYWILLFSTCILCITTVW
jgi:hypothetical protein